MTTLKNLQDFYGHGVDLHCLSCWNKYSANPADYSFWIKDNHIFHCDCGDELVLAREQGLIKYLQEEKHQDNCCCIECGDLQ